jgi:TetR/AcrR family transcriptional repressor of lmrAB and yxaGH operons
MISTAVTLFRREGYTATSWRHLVEQAGTPWGSAYHHFPGGKEQLAVAAIELATVTTSATITRAFERNDTIAEAVAWWFTKAAQALANGDYRAGCPLATIALETVNDSEVLTQACKTAFTTWQNELENHLREHDHPAPEDLAAAIMHNMEGALLMARVHNSPEPLTRAAGHIAILAAHTMTRRLP